MHLSGSSEDSTAMTTFKEIADLWMNEIKRTRRPKTLQSYGNALKQLYSVLPDLDSRPIARPDLLKFRNHRADSVSNYSANRDIKAIKACLSWAEMNELGHPRVPLQRLTLPPPPRKDETLSDDEISRVFEAAALDRPCLVILKIAHGTGFRLGEILNLWWENVDADEGSISVTAKPDWQPKTNSAIRTVFAPHLVKWLGHYRESIKHSKESDYVAQMDEKDGTRWRPTSQRVHVRLREVYTNAGVEGKKPTHAMRHTMASDLVQSGAPIHVAQKHLGHASASVTLAVYSHAQKSGLKTAGDALEEYRKGKRA